MFISDFFTNAKKGNRELKNLNPHECCTNCPKLNRISFLILHYYLIVLHDLLVWYSILAKSDFKHEFVT